MTLLGESAKGAGQAFQLMTDLWCEEIECGHRRGEAQPHWLTEKDIGISRLPHHHLKLEVEKLLGILPSQIP